MDCTENIKSQSLSTGDGQLQKLLIYSVLEILFYEHLAI